MYNILNNKYSTIIFRIYKLNENELILLLICIYFLEYYIYYSSNPSFEIDSCLAINSSTFRWW